MYKLLVVDDHPVIGAALKLLLAKSATINEITVAITARQARERFRAMNHELLIVDLDLPDMAGVDLIRLIRMSNATAKILVYSSKRYEIFSSRLEKLNISGFLSKLEDISRLVSIVELVAQGYSVVPPGGSTHPENPFNALSERELSIANLISKRNSNRAIADMLSISEKTVAVHKMNILRKLGVTSAIDIALLSQLHRLD